MTTERNGVLAVMDDAIGRRDLVLKDMIEARAAVAELIEYLRKIELRAKPHPDDNDEDHRRNLYHVESIARIALIRAGCA